MGTGASRCPADEMMHRKRQQAIRKRYTEAEPSELYRACRDGDTNYLREHLTKMTIDDVDKLEAFGDTALHVATRNEHEEIVQLLLNTRCSRTTLNFNGKMPHEEIKTPTMEKIYERPTPTRFHEFNHKLSFETFIPDHQEHKKDGRDWIKTFESENELKDYTLSHQTAAMWFRFFNWVSHTFSGILNRRDFDANLFDLEHDRDFLEFLRQAVPDVASYEEVKATLSKAESGKSIVPLIELYTSEFGNGNPAFYVILNKQLTLAAANNINTAHFCDRFVYEFSIKKDQLEGRAYSGETFRGISMEESDIEIYEALTIDEKTAVIATKIFTSTTRSKEVALGFANSNPKGGKPVLFIYNISTPCNMIVSVENISHFPKEKEVLIIPGTLFRVRSVDKSSSLTQIYLDHINVTISFYKKLIHTIKGARQRPNVY